MGVCQWGDGECLSHRHFLCQHCWLELVISSLRTEALSAPNYPLWGGRLGVQRVSYRPFCPKLLAAAANQLIWKNTGTESTSDTDTYYYLAGSVGNGSEQKMHIACFLLQASNFYTLFPWDLTTLARYFRTVGKCKSHFTSLGRLLKKSPLMVLGPIVWIWSTLWGHVQNYI